MSTPAELVTDAFAQAESYAANAMAGLASFTSRLNAAVQNAPLIDVTFTPISAPGASSAPTSAPAWESPAEYTSGLLDSIGAAITSRMAGGTGLPEGVEQGIWDRERERELATMQAAIDNAMYDSEALGFALPPGVLNDGVRRAQRAYYDNVAAASRDAAIKQAELEQSNLQKIFEQAVNFEGVLADIRLKNSQVAVQVFEAQIEGHKADIMRFTAEVEQDVKLWEASIKQNEAIAEYTLNGTKINTEIVRANLSAILEAGKTGAQVYAQLAGSAYGMIHASTSTAASANMGVTYSFANDTSNQPAAITSI